MEIILLETEKTMHIHVNGRNIEITDAIKAYVKEKAGKVAAHYEQIDAIDAILSVIKNPSVSDSHIAEINCKIGGETIRVEEQAESMYAAIDLVCDKLDRQVKKFKDKALGSDKSSIRTPELEETVEAVEEEVVES